MGTSRVLLVFALLCLGSFTEAAHDPNKLFGLDEWVSHRIDRKDKLARTLIDESVAALERRKERINRLSTAAEWTKYRDEVRAKFKPMLESSFPETKTPLNVNITNTIVDPRGFTIEKLYFESRPNFFVTAAVFRPTNNTGKHPAVLHASGHTPYAFRYRSSGSYQLACISLALKGFVVLAFDAMSLGERVMYWDKNRRQSMLVGACSFDPITFERKGSGCTKEHSFYGRQLHLNGISTASMFVWDSLRALDYLIGREDVDGEKIAMFGCSGGGTQTAYLGAYDERLKAVSIACYMGSLAWDMPYQGTADAEQVWRGGSYLGLDKADLLHARLPNPTHVQMTTNDDCFPIQGGREAAREAQKSFSAVGTPQNFLAFEDVYGHGTTPKTRESMYGFFMQKFGMEGEPTEPSVKALDYKDLLVTKDGQVSVSLNSRVVAHLLRDFTQSNVQKVTSARQANYADFLQSLPSLARDVIGFHPQSDLPIMEREPTGLGRVTVGGVYDAEKWMVPTRGHCSCMLEIYALPEWDIPVPPPSIFDENFRETPSNSTTNDTRSAVVIVSRDGPESQASRNLIDAIVASGKIAAIVNPCGFADVGDAFPNAPHAEHDYSAGHVGFLAEFVNQTVVGIHAYEFGVTLSFLQKRLSGIGSKIESVVAKDFLGSAVAHLGVLERGGLLRNLDQFTQRDWLVPSLAIVRDAVSYADIAMAPFYSTPTWMDIGGITQHYDLCDIYAAFAPSPLLLLSPVSPDGIPIKLDQLNTTLQRTMEAYRSTNANAMLTLSAEDTTKPPKAIIDWLKVTGTVASKGTQQMMLVPPPNETTQVATPQGDMETQITDAKTPANEGNTDLLAGEGEGKEDFESGTTEDIAKSEKISQSEESALQSNQKLPPLYPGSAADEDGYSSWSAFVWVLPVCGFVFLGFVVRRTCMTKQKHKLVNLLKGKSEKDEIAFTPLVGHDPDD